MRTLLGKYPLVRECGGYPKYLARLALAMGDRPLHKIHIGDVFPKGYLKKMGSLVADTSPIRGFFGNSGDFASDDLNFKSFNKYDTRKSGGKTKKDSKSSDLGKRAKN